MTAKTKAIVGLGLVAGLGAAVLPLASYADTDTKDAQVQVSVNESITITQITNSAMGLSFTGANISAGTVLSGDHAVTVSTSSATGYTLTMSTPNGGTLNATDGLSPEGYTGAAAFQGIGAGSVVGAIATNAYNVAALTTGVTFTPTPPPANGLWGYRLAGWTTDNYVSVPTTPFAIAASNAAAAAEVTTVTFGVQAGTTTAAGTYGAWISYVATTN